jgi:aryl-alcohol dehydrogenase-like predicted oxidoreductase
LHRSEQYLGTQGTALYKALLRLKDNGQVQKLGVSIYMPAELDTLIPQYPIDLVQAPFNLVDQRLLTTGWLDRLKNDGIELHTRSSFLQGLLLMPRDAIPEQFSIWNQLWDRWNLWLQECRLPVAKVCLDFVRSFDQIDRIVIGADSLVQLEQLISFAGESPKLEFPAMLCNDEMLINPTNWSSLGKQK